MKGGGFLKKRTGANFENKMEKEVVVSNKK